MKRATAGVDADVRSVRGRLRCGHALDRPWQRGANVRGGVRRVIHARHGFRQHPGRRHVRRRGRHVQVRVRGPLLHVIAPELRPRHAREREEQHHGRSECARHRVQVAPESARLRRAADRDDAARAPTRPPQEYAGGDQHDRPTCRNLDQRAGPETEVLKAMHLADQLHDAAGRRRAQEAAVSRVDVCSARLARRDADEQAQRAIRTFRQRDLLDSTLEGSLGFEDARHEWRAVFRPGGDFDQVAIQRVIELWFEEIQRACDGEQHEKRQHQQAGIEMPAPYGAIQGRGVDATLHARSGLAAVRSRRRVKRTG